MNAPADTPESATEPTEPTEPAETAGPLRPGTMVYDVAGDPEDESDTGIVFSIQDGGYGVIWTGDMTPKFAAADEVAVLPSTRMNSALGVALEALDNANGAGDRDDEDYRSCRTHCCLRHGCKYSHANCPVVQGRQEQAYPCERCTDSIDDAARWGEGPYSTPGEIGFDLTVALARADQTMADMPSAAQVHAAVEKALSGLTLNGWSLTRLISDSTADDLDDPDGEE